MMLVPESKSKNFNAEDKSIPKHIQDNILKVLNDAKKDSKALPNGINLFSELDFQASGDMKDLMSFIGMDSELIVPLSGSISPNIFNTKASFKEKYTGTSLNVPMPKIKLPSMPGSFKFIAPEFHITDKSPNGKEELWTGILTGINGDLLGQKINFNSNIGFSDDEISLNADSAMQLPSPFGIKWLTLKDLGLNIDYDKKNKTGKFEFTATTLKPFGKIQPNISVDLKEEGGKLKAGVLKIKDNISFSDIPIMNKLPHVENFAFTFLDISNTGISGGSILNGLEIDVTVFENAGKWIFAISDDGGGEGFNFSRLIKGLEKTPLGDFHLHDAALVFSEGKLSSPVSSMPEVALPVFKGLYGSDDAMVNISPGITIAANFSPGKSSGSAKGGLSGIGIANDILIEGSLKNIFGGKGMPSIKILVQTEQGPSSGKASHSPKMLNFPGSVGFFIELEEESFEVGLQSDVVLDLPKKQKLDLISRLELGINEKGFNIDIFLDLKGNWNEPFGIPGLDLEEVALKFGIDDIGEVTFGFKGTSEIAETKVDLAAEMSFLLEAEGLPDGVAIKGEIEDLNIPHLIELAETMAGGDAKALFGDNIPLPEFKDVAFAFATPGMSDPDLGLVDSGFLMKGKCFLLGQELGSTLVSVGPSGIKLDDEIADIDLKILKLKNNVMKLNVGFTAPPSFLISSDFDFLGVTQKADVSFNDGIYEMTIVDKIGNIWESEITFGFGFDPDAQGVPDIFIEGLIKEDMFDYLKTQAPKKVEEYFSVLDDGYKAAVQKINGAKAKVRSIDGRIQREKEKIQRARNNAESAVRNAENRVRQLQNNANGARSAYESNRHRCGWRHPSACVREGWYWGKWRGEQAAANAAMAVLRSVQSTLQHLPSELMDPTLIGLET